MSVLARKLRRDLRRMAGQVLSIALVVASGIAVYLACVSTYRSLVQTKEAYYRRTAFADVFAPLKRAPKAVAARLAALPGVAAAQVRVAQEATADLGDPRGPASLQVLGLPADPAGGLDRLTLRRGRWPEPGRDREVVASEAFAQAHGLGDGSPLVVVLQGRKLRLQVVGRALSPEFIYPIRPGEFLPDDRRFGVLWMGEEALAAASGYAGAFNEAHLALARGASEPAAIAAVDRVLEPYGGLGAYGRRDHLSNRYLEDELKQLRIHAVTVPAIFLGVATFLLSVVMARLVATERTQIATLKALGYGNAAVGRHYLAFALAIVALGAGLGLAAGVWTGRAMTVLYTRFFHFPDLHYRAEPWVAALGLGLCAAAALGGALGAVGRVVRLPPAEAMQPPSPATYRRGWLDRLPGFLRAAQQARMVARHVARRPLRTVLGILGIASAAAILVLGSFWLDTFRYLTHVQYTWVQREDVAVGFTGPVPATAARDLGALPGVLKSEPVRAVPVVLRAGHRLRRTVLVGVDPAHRLHGLLDEGLRPIPVPAEGLLLSRRLAERLQVGPGDRVRVEVREGRRAERSVPVAALAEEMLGFAAYLEAGALGRLLGEGPSASSALLAVDPASEGELYRRLAAMPKVASVTPKRAALAVFRETTEQYVTTFTLILVAFALVLVVGVVYNGARIILAERTRDLATLRVLGFTAGEVFRLFAAELSVQVAAGLPLGLWLGARAAAVMMEAEAPEAFQLPLVIEPATFVRAAGAVLLAGLATALASRRALTGMDLVAVLKTRE